MNLWLIAGGVMLTLAAACGLLFYLYGNARESGGAVKQSNVQLQEVVKDKVDAQKQRSTIERKNQSADYPSLVNKL